MVTSEMKDQVLKYLCDHCPLERAYQLEYEELSDIVSEETLKSILLQFERLKLLPELNYYGNTYIIVLQLEAHDLLRRGGFSSDDQLFISNLAKLQAELEKLQADIDKPALSMADKVSILTNIMSIAGNTIGFLG